MKQVYTQQAVVRVWRNLKVLGNVPTQHFGHASVTVTGTTVPQRMQHISFWPKDGVNNRLGAFRSQEGSTTGEPDGDSSDGPMLDRVAEMNTLTAIRLEVGYCKTHGIVYPAVWDEALRLAHKSPLFALRQGQKRLEDVDGKVLTSNETGIEVPLYSQSPQAKFFLPGLGADDRLWGLNLTRMANWWKDFLKVQPQYQAFSRQNCVGIALRALQEGGAGAIVKPPNIRVYGEPIQVEQYANELFLQFDRLENWAKTLNTEIDQAVAAGQVRVLDVPGADLSDGLWLVNAWKDASALGVLSRRSDAIRKIDESLERFHGLTWKSNFLERYEAFVQLFLAVCKHREDKAESKRSDAVVRLAGQILTILRNRRFYRH